MDVAEAQRQITELFEKETLPRNIKNSWEMHQFYKQAYPDGEKFDDTNSGASSFKLLRSSQNRSNPITLAVTSDNRIGKVSSKADFFEPIKNDGRVQLTEINSLNLSPDGRWAVVSMENPNDNVDENLPFVVGLAANRFVGFRQTYSMR